MPASPSVEQPYCRTIYADAEGATRRHRIGVRRRFEPLLLVVLFEVSSPVMTLPMFDSGWPPTLTPDRVSLAVL